MIEASVTKAIMVWAVDRLFRDEDMVEPAVFVRICKKNHTIILTVDDYFDFNNPKRDDRKRFLELAQAAADYVTKHIKGRMLPARAQVAKRGEYDGRSIAVGLMMVEDEKKPLVFLPQAEVVRFLFKRFRQLDAQFNKLWREVASKKDLFPPYPKGEGIYGVRKERFEGSFCITREGLRSLLTNTMYIGTWYYQQKDKSTVLIENNHPALIDGKSTDIEGDVVTEEDFWFSFNRLSKTTIIGEPNELKKARPATRFDRVGTIPAEALLDGIVTSPVAGHHIYVYQRAQKPGKAIYIIIGPEHTTPGTDRACIMVKKLDEVFTEKLEYRLRLFQAMDALKEKMQPGKSRETSMYEYLKQVQATIKQADAGVDSQMLEYSEEAENLDRILRLGAKTLDDVTIIRYTERLARLNRTLSVLKKKNDDATKSETALKATANMLVDASVSYDKFPFGRKMDLVRLVTTRIEFSEPIPRWFRLEIEWSPFLNVTVKDVALIWRPDNSAGNWTGEEIDILKSLYEGGERSTIIKALPKRSWNSITTYASSKGLERKKWDRSALPMNLSFLDHQFIQEMELEYTEERLKKGVWWKTLANEKNASSTGAFV